MDVTRYLCDCLRGAFTTDNVRAACILKNRRNNQSNALGYALSSVKIVISGLTLNLTCHRCPSARFTYSVRSPDNAISPDEYLLFFTGNMGAGKNGGLH